MQKHGSLEHTSFGIQHFNGPLRCPKKGIDSRQHLKRTRADNIKMTYLASVAFYPNTYDTIYMWKRTDI